MEHAIGKPGYPESGQNILKEFCFFIHITAQYDLILQLQLCSEKARENTKH